MADVRSRFVADVMLGRLARWLRFLGYDTLYDNRAEDATLIRIAHLEQRVLLTRDTGLMARVPDRALFIRSGVPLEQLDEVRAALHLLCLEPRCTMCNGTVLALSPDQVRPFVPDYVARTQTHFFQCEGCTRIYWRGTHVARMRASLGQAAF